MTAREWLESSEVLRIARSVAHRYGVRAEDLPDLAQEIRTAVWGAGLDTPLSAAWVFRTAEHKASDARREQARCLRVLEGRIDVRASGSADVELSALLSARWSTLPRECRAVFGLHLEGFSEREIARKLDMGRGTVRGIIGWTLRFLRRTSGAERMDDNPANGERRTANGERRTEYGERSTTLIREVLWGRSTSLQILARNRRYGPRSSGIVSGFLGTATCRSRRPRETFGLRCRYSHRVQRGSRRIPACLREATYAAFSSRAEPRDALRGSTRTTWRTTEGTSIGRRRRASYGASRRSFS